MTVPHLFGMLVTGGAGGGGISDPTDIAGCVGWYDAADTATISQLTAGKCDQWDDKSGSGRNFGQAGASTLRPSTGVDSQNGLNVLTFDGGDYLFRSSSFLYSLVTTSVFIVADYTTTGNAALFSEGRSTNANGEYGSPRIISSNLSAYQQNDDGSDEYNISSDNFATGGYHIARFQDSGTVASLCVDGGTVTSSASYARGTFTPNRTAIGARFRNTIDLHFTGKIAEIVIYNSVLSAGDITLVEDYLTDKWGL
jgi:hypothetical protein